MMRIKITFTDSNIQAPWNAVANDIFQRFDFTFDGIAGLDSIEYETSTDLATIQNYLAEFHPSVSCSSI